jgi:hypothetical protein
VEAARLRTKGLYSKEIVIYLGKEIPQTPSMSTFLELVLCPPYELFHLYDLMSQETSNHSVNVSKIPVPGYGTRDSPGQIALWLISLGSQKDSILQWLGKDELIKPRNFRFHYFKLPHFVNSYELTRLRRNTFIIIFIQLCNIQRNTHLFFMRGVVL